MRKSKKFQTEHYINYYNKHRLTIGGEKSRIVRRIHKIPSYSDFSSKNGPRDTS